MPRFRNRAPIVQPAARARALTVQAARKAARARLELAIVIPLIALVLIANEYRQEIFGLDLPVRVFTAIALLILGWRLARDVGRTLAPGLFKRMDPATAGTVGFLIRFAFLVAAMLLALRIAGLEPRTLAVSGAIVAVVFGLAAQQTLGNLIAGVVLISARPFRVGDRVRLQSGGLAGEIEGIVASLGLLYTTFARGEDSIMVPNNIVLASAVVPLREPSSRRPAGAAPARRDAERGAGAARGRDPDAGALRAAHRRRGDRQRRDRGPHRRHAGGRVGRPAPRGRDPRGDRADHARGADGGARGGARAAAMTAGATNAARARRPTLPVTSRRSTSPSAGHDECRLMLP